MPCWEWIFRRNYELGQWEPLFNCLALTSPLSQKTTSPLSSVLFEHFCLSSHCLLMCKWLWRFFLTGHLQPGKFAAVGFPKRLRLRMNDAQKLKSCAVCGPAPGRAASQGSATGNEMRGSVLSRCPCHTPTSGAICQGLSFLSFKSS